MSTISRTAAGVSKDLFSETMDKILNSQPTAKVTTTLMTTMTTTVCRLRNDFYITKLRNSLRNQYLAGDYKRRGNNSGGEN